MKDAPPPILDRIRRKLGYFRMRRLMRQYYAAMAPDNILRSLPGRVVGDASADPEEFFTHYDAFAFWVAANLPRLDRPLNILDVGSPKMMTAMLSAAHNVTSSVLADCSDSLSRTRYLLHDICDPLPVEDGRFDCFTSSVALPLVGLARYGDRLDPDCLPNFVRELRRVMTADATLLISLSVGPNILAFNNAWFLDLEIWKAVFRGWDLIEILVDHQSAPGGFAAMPGRQRFDQALNISAMSPGDYRVVFTRWRRAV